MEQFFGSIKRHFGFPGRQIEVAPLFDDRMQEYVSRIRYGKDRDELKLRTGQSVDIPLTQIHSMKFIKESGDWTTDRDIDDYLASLFNDEYDSQPRPGNAGTQAFKRTDESGVVAGGINQALAAGRVVIDIGSGEAVGLLQLSQLYPHTKFIGIDKGYEKVIKPDLRMKGVQLTKDDWSSLATLPDRSVDTILSLQGVFRWGIYPSNPEAQRILSTLTRVAKQGAIMRFDISNYPVNKSGNEFIFQQLQHSGWKVTSSGETAIAIKN